MKFKGLIFIVMLGISVPCFGQRYDEGQSAHLSVGYVKRGYFITLGYEKFLTRNDAISFDIEYAGRTAIVRTAEDNAKLSDFSFNATYRRYFNLNRIFPYVGCGLFGGYQYFSNKSDFPTSIMINRESGAIFGISPEIGVEFNFKAISLTVAVAPRYEFMYKEFLPVIKAGIKYFF